MKTVSSHLQELHERTGRDSELLKEEHLAIAAHHKRIAELHRELGKSSGSSDSLHEQLADEHDKLRERHETLAKRIGEYAEYHRKMKLEAGKAATASDLLKSAVVGRDSDLVPTRVHGIGAIPPGLRLVSRTGNPNAREATNDAPVAPQLAKIVAFDDD